MYKRLVDKFYDHLDPNLTLKEQLIKWLESDFDIRWQIWHDVDWKNHREDVVDRTNWWIEEHPSIDICFSNDVIDRIVDIYEYNIRSYNDHWRNLCDMAIVEYVWENVKNGINEQ